MTPHSPRILGIVRLSVTSDDSTSPEKQRAAVEHWSAGPAISGRIIGWAEDLDVSGGLDPFRRPKLGPWLTDRRDDFDVIAAWKLDRITRRSIHFAELHAWCQQHGKTIVSVTESIDMSTPMGKMFAAIIAAFAEGELDTIRARAESGALARLRKGVWVGGVLPCGYNFVKLESGGKKLVQDPGYAPVVEEIIERFSGDTSPYRLASEFNSRNIPTWRDYLRITQGQKSKGINWVTGTVMAILRNVALAGLYTYKGQIVEDEEGNPVSITDAPYLSFETWSSLNATITTKKESKALRATPSRSMLGGVAICGQCGSKMASSMKTRDEKRYAYYACNALQSGTCKNAALIKREALDAIVDRAVTTLLGDREVMERVPRDSSARVSLGQLTQRLDRLEAEELEGKYDGEGQRESFLRMHSSLSAKIASLRAQIASEEALPTMRGTGRTYVEIWTEKDAEQRRAFLLAHGVKVEVRKRPADHAVLVRIDAERVGVAIGASEDTDMLTGLEVGYTVARRQRGEIVIEESPVTEIDWALETA